MFKKVLLNINLSWLILAHQEENSLEDHIAEVSELSTEERIISRLIEADARLNEDPELQEIKQLWNTSSKSINSLKEEWENFIEETKSSQPLKNFIAFLYEVERDNKVVKILMEAGEGLALGSKETVNSLGSDGSHIENSTVNEALTYSMSRKSQIMVRYVLKKSGCLYQSIWIGEKSLYALIKQIKEPEVLEILKALCSYSIYIKIDHEIIDKRIHK